MRITLFFYLDNFLAHVYLSKFPITCIVHFLCKIENTGGEPGTSLSFNSTARQRTVRTQQPNCFVARRRTSSEHPTCRFLTSQTLVVWIMESVASLGGGPPRVTPSRGWHPKENFFVGKFTKIVEKRGRTGKKGVGWHPRGGWHPSESNKKR